MLTKISKFILPLCAILLTGLTPLLWFHGHLITGEEFYALDYGMWGKIYTQGWAPNVNFGEFSLFLPFKLQYLFFHLFEILNINYYYALVSWHVLAWVITGLFFYLFIKQVYREKMSPLIAVIAIIFYVFNPFFLNISVLLTPPRILFMFLPLIFALLHKYIIQDQGGYKIIAALSLITFFVSPLYVNIPYGSIIFIVIALGIVYKNVFIRTNFRNLLLHFMFFIVLSSLLNIWWAVPFVMKIRTNVGDIKGTTSNFVTIAASKTQDVLTYFGSWAFREKATEEIYYFPYYKNYDRFPLVAARFLPFLLIAGVPFFLIKQIKKREKNSESEFLLFLVGMAWLFILLAKGISGFGGSIFGFFYDNVPLFWFFREPYAKFMPVYALIGDTLLVYTLIKISTELKSRNFLRILLFVILIISGVALGRPYWSAEVVGETENKKISSQTVIVPDYWEDLRENWEPKKGYYVLYPTFQVSEYLKWPSGYN